jgi:ribonucleotide reductase beta subunit family protein with ferritin-like domain
MSWLSTLFQQSPKESERVRDKMSAHLVQYNKTYKPFMHPWAVDLTIRHEKAHWVEEEVDLSEDVQDWKSGKMSALEKSYVMNILRLFTQSDVAVGQNYYDYFIPFFKNNEIRNMLGSFACREGTHQRAYALFTDTLCLSDSEYHAFLAYTEMTDKVEYMQKADLSTTHGVALALVKSVFNEGVSLFSSFAMLLHFQQYGKMKGMCKVVEWSVRDETMHVEGITQLFHKVCSDTPELTQSALHGPIRQIAAQVIELEDRFIDLAYTEIGTLENMTKDDMKTYIRYIADNRLVCLGQPALFNIAKNPLPWMEWILNGVDHTNFFENKVTEYDIGGLKGTWHDAYSN